MTAETCPFCDLSKRVTQWTLLNTYLRVWAVEPLNPVVKGHTLIVPEDHVTSAIDAPHVTGYVMEQASLFAARFDSANIITSIGRPATQSVFHLHIHVVPRAANDGLALPWYSGKSKR